MTANAKGTVDRDVLDAAVDIVVVTPDDIRRFGNSHALVIKPALQEGRVV